MSRPPIQSIKLSEHLTLSERHPDYECRQINWWLYDKRAGMNLGMRKQSKEEAMVAAIDYWARRFIELDKRHRALCNEVDRFIDAVRPSELDPP